MVAEHDKAQGLVDGGAAAKAREAVECLRRAGPVELRNGLKHPVLYMWRCPSHASRSMGAASEQLGKANNHVERMILDVFDCQAEHTQSQPGRARAAPSVLQLAAALAGATGNHVQWPAKTVPHLQSTSASIRSAREVWQPVSTAK